jgi:hypothetical protein
MRTRRKERRQPYVPAEPKEAAVARASREKTVAWLSKSKPTDTTQATALRLLLDVRTGKGAEHLQAGIDHLLKRQNADGGCTSTSRTGLVAPWFFDSLGRVHGSRKKIGNRVSNGVSEGIFRRTDQVIKKRLISRDLAA